MSHSVDWNSTGEYDPPTREEQEGDAWEHWHQRAMRAEADLHELRQRITIHDAWPVVLKWLEDYEDEQEWFGPYKDHVSLDGIMTAAQRRAISASLKTAE